MRAYGSCFEQNNADQYLEKKCQSFVTSNPPSHVIWPSAAKMKLDVYNFSVVELFAGYQRYFTHA